MQLLNKITHKQNKNIIAVAKIADRTAYDVNLPSAKSNTQTV